MTSIKKEKKDIIIDLNDQLKSQMNETEKLRSEQVQNTYTTAKQMN